MKHFLLLLTLATSCIYTQLSFGQVEKKTPKVGLVLSGGGARGMAHIGVLKALEEAGIYPDVITGTSMGSVVGGLYALGFTADEIEQIANEADWDALLYNLVPFKEIAIEEKPYYWRYMFELPVYGITPELPSGVIEGENLYKFFSEITRSAHGLKSFDELPIPFRCVATDIETGKRVVLSKGSLASSIRASMAIPSIFTPVEINNQLLVDGGLVRNLPVQEAKEMGADIIIGVSVSEGLAKKEDLNSLAAILVQSSWLMSEFDTREQKKMVNLYLEPDLKGYGVADFAESEGIIARGEAIGETFLPQFKALADSLKDLGKQFTKPKKLDQLDTYAIQKVSVQGNNRIPTEIILGKLRITEGEELDVDEINARLREVYGTQYFTKLEYDIIKEGEGYELLIKVKEKPQVYFKAALYYNTETRAGLNINLTARNKIWPNSRMLAEIDLSENFRTEFSFLKYFGKKQNAAATLGYQSLASKIPIFNNGASVGVFDDYHHNFYWLLQTTKRSTSSTGLRLDATIKRYNPEEPDAFWTEVEKVREYSALASIFYTKNTLNNPVMPTRGVRFDASIGYRFFNELNYDFEGNNETSMQFLDSVALAVNTHPEVRLALNYFLPVTSSISLFTDTQLNYIFSNQTGLGQQTGLGGFYLNHPNTRAFWGASFYQFRALSYALVRLGLQWEPINDFFVLGGINYANSQYPMQWFDNDFNPIQLDVDNDLWGGGVQVIYNTRFGPIGAAIGRAQNSNKWQLGFNIGFWY